MTRLQHFVICFALIFCQGNYFHDLYIFIQSRNSSFWPIFFYSYIHSFIHRFIHCLVFHLFLSFTVGWFHSFNPSFFLTFIFVNHYINFNKSIQFYLIFVSRFSCQFSVLFGGWGRRREPQRSRLRSYATQLRSLRRKVRQLRTQTQRYFSMPILKYSKVPKTFIAHPTILKST